jgi:hypothetical protein
MANDDCSLLDPPYVTSIAASISASKRAVNAAGSWASGASEAGADS